MDDKMENLLKSVKPMPAPAGMDESILTEARKVAAGIRLKRRLVFALPVMAAAAVLLAIVLFFVTARPVGKDVALPDGKAKEAASAAEDMPDASENIAARARLLEVKVSRLKALALMSKDMGRHFKSLDDLEKELENISKILETRPVENNNGDESGISGKTGGKRNA